MNKNKIYDCFLYFQEFEILEIRIKYLYKYVDHFIIVEFDQTFSGRKKKFNLEIEMDKLSPFRDKIFYFKIKDFHHSFDNLISRLEQKGDKISKIIRKNMLSHRHYNRNEINWVIDTYQRESIYYALNEFEINDDDLIIISDLDEIPNYQIIDNLKKDFPYEIISFKQNAYSFFLNLLSSNEWYGSIVAKWGKLDYTSLNTLRLDVREKFKIVKDVPFVNGGYHFTSIGSIESIKEKIRNMGHQELNNRLILSRVKKNILSGRDIFGRKIGQIYKIIDLEDKKFFDDKMSKIIEKNYSKFLIRKLHRGNIFIDIIFFFGVKIFQILYLIKIKIGFMKKI